MPMSAPVSDLSRLSLKDIARLIENQQRPPTETWRPSQFGESLMTIRRDGSWWHDGGKIEREAMVRLFASILWREEDGSYALVTPHEKQRIEVEDVPFLAVELKTDGAGSARTIAFRLNTGELLIAGPSHPLRFDEARPYLTVRSGIEARIDRPLYYELAEIAIAEGGNPPGVWSGGAFFTIESAA